ncbi:MAG: NYN domain-containing protein [Candidatus Gracilibacteria bacterium]|nr:NYN domain-containing protein [Candidatus Gracilibacteria bacterium]
MSQNYAFIDAQNLNSGLSKLGWKIDWKRFREYLREEADIEVAYVFLGFMLGNQDLYLMLQKSGFVVVFKEILTMESGEVKGNIDAELILQAMIDYDRYDQALIVSGDGDFTCLLRYLKQNDKLLGVLAPYEKGLSSLIQKVAEGKIEYLRILRKKVEYRPLGGKKKSHHPLPPMRSDIEVSEAKNNGSQKPKNIPSSKPGRSPRKPEKSTLHTERRTKQVVSQKTEQSSPKKGAPRKGTLYTGGIQ